MSDQPPLKPLHSALVQIKLRFFEKLDSEILTKSLEPGQEHCLKTRPDGTILDGHHRIHVLRLRGVDVDALPRQIIVKQE